MSLMMMMQVYKMAPHSRGSIIIIIIIIMTLIKD
jgi:hypothetical protein